MQPQEITPTTMRPTTDRHACLAELETLRPYLLRIARLQLRHDTWAEDVVSETMLSALEKIDSFRGQSRFRTWVVAILRNKAIDHLRRHHREVPLSDHDEADDDDIEALIFNARGGFRQRPDPWSDPQGALDERQFLAIIEACVERLPSNQGRVFLMREWLEMDADEICKEIGVTPSNLWVLLHRARLRLRECVQARWQGVAQK